MTDAAFDQLATQRSDAIMAELASLGGISTERIVPGQMDAAGEVVDKVVRLRLQLEIGK